MSWGRCSQACEGCQQGEIRISGKNIDVIDGCRNAAFGLAALLLGDYSGCNI